MEKKELGFDVNNSQIIDNENQIQIKRRNKTFIDYVNVESWLQDHSNQEMDKRE